MPTEKQINQLPDANRYLSSTDFLAFEDANNVTYKISGDRLGISPYAATITSGQWSGSGSDYYITVSASNVTVDSILIPHYDNASLQYLQGPVWCVPAAGSFTIHTSALPTGTVTILVQFIGIVGEAQYQVLADVYSTSQAVAKADIVNSLVSTATDKPLSAAQGKALNDTKVWNLGAFTKSSKSAVESELTSKFNAMSDGDFAIFWMQGNYSGSMTNGGWRCTSLYRRSSTNGQLNMMGVTTFAVYDGSSWSWL